MLKTVSLVYAALAVSHWAFLPADLALPISAAAFAAVAFSLFALRAARKKPAHAVNAHFIGGCVAWLCLLNSLLHLELTWEPHQTTNLLLVIVALGVFALDRVVAYGSAALGVGLWVSIASESWSEEWQHYAFAMALACAVMAVAFESRMKLYRSLFETERRLRREALTDRLTGLPNRTYLMERLSFLSERGRTAPDLHFGVCFVDVDDLKTTNDELGHAVGDRVLQEIADRLRGQCRFNEALEIDLAGRLGGDEFLIIFDDIQSPSELEAIRTRVAAALSKSPVRESGEAPVSASVGACWSGDVEPLTVEKLLTRADRLMYDHKTAGRAIG